MVESLRDGTLRHPLNERERENQAQERGTKMVQFFNRDQAQSLLDEIVARFPGLVVEVSDIHNSKTGEYHYSYVAVWGSTDQTRCITTFSDHETFEQWLEICQYIAGAIADNQQSEEVDRYHDPKWEGIHVNYPSSTDNQQSEELALDENRQVLSKIWPGDF